MKKLLALALLAGTILSAPSYADSIIRNNQEKPDYLTVGVGFYEALNRHNSLPDNRATDFRVEYRPAYSIIFKDLQPWFGLEFTDDSTIWGGAGLAYDWNFTGNWYLTPVLAVGLYNQGASDLDLDHPIEFKEQLELSYKFENDHKFGIAISHLSNASLGDSNPGVEAVTMSWSFPF